MHDSPAASVMVNKLKTWLNLLMKRLIKMKFKLTLINITSIQISIIKKLFLLWPTPNKPIINKMKEK
jgi:hypothetical protein